MVLNNRIQELQERIDRAESEIQEIRLKCSHPTYTVHMYSFRPGWQTPQRLCDECGSVLPGIPQEEIEGYFEQNPNFNLKTGFAN